MNIIFALHSDNLLFRPYWSYEIPFWNSAQISWWTNSVVYEVCNFCDNLESVYLMCLASVEPSTYIWGEVTCLSEQLKMCLHIQVWFCFLYFYKNHTHLGVLIFCPNMLVFPVLPFLYFLPSLFFLSATPMSCNVIQVFPILKANHSLQTNAVKRDCLHRHRLQLLCANTALRVQARHVQSGRFFSQALQACTVG